jgi:hypothetical protein
MEGDFNASNKISFGQQMMDKARGHKLIPEEICSERNCLPLKDQFGIWQYNFFLQIKLIIIIGYIFLIFLIYNFTSSQFEVFINNEF